MSEPRIGRVLVASLHQAIADLLPTRLEFYENWLNVSGLREGTIGLAPLSAVLSFLPSSFMLGFDFGIAFLHVSVVKGFEFAFPMTRCTACPEVHAEGTR